MIRCENVRFSYPGDPFSLRVGHFIADSGETVALVGPSGCGKTTLLNLIAGVLVPEEGAVEVDGEPVSSLTRRGRQEFRLGHIGLVPQNFALLDYLTVRENVLVPFRLSGKGRIPEAAETRADELLERAGIASLSRKFPDHLSQGERQRVAACRGLVAEPAVLLADEPTGNLDPANQDKIVGLLLDESARIGATVVMITHEPSLAERFVRTVDLLELRKEVAE